MNLFGGDNKDKTLPIAQQAQPVAAAPIHASDEIQKPATSADELRGGPDTGQDQSAVADETAAPEPQDGHDIGPPVHDLSFVTAAVKAAIDAKLTETVQLLRTRLARDEILANLQKEVHDFRADLLRKAMRPLVLDVIKLHTDVSKMREGIEARAAESDPLEAYRSLVSNIVGDIEQLLGDNGVDVFSEANTGQPFDPQRQTAVDFMPTDSPELDGRVEKLVRAGFASGEQVVQKQRVRLYRMARKP